jgi:hypothetical protein
LLYSRFVCGRKPNFLNDSSTDVNPSTLIAVGLVPAWRPSMEMSAPGGVVTTMTVWVGRTSVSSITAALSGVGVTTRVIA